jgi:hypothetical protein
MSPLLLFFNVDPVIYELAFSPLLRAFNPLCWYNIGSGRLVGNLVTKKLE